MTYESGGIVRPVHWWQRLRTFLRLHRRRDPLLISSPPRGDDTD